MTWKGEEKLSNKSRPLMKRSQSIAGITKRSRGKIDRRYRRSNPYTKDIARILKRSSSISESTALKKPLPVLTCGSQFRLMNTWNQQSMRQQQQQHKQQQPPLRGWAISDMSSLLRETLNLQKSLQGHAENMNKSDKDTSLAVDFDKAVDLSKPKVFRSEAKETMAEDHAATNNDNDKLQDNNKNFSHQLAQRDETQACAMNSDENSLPCATSDVNADKNNQLLSDVTASSYFTISTENTRSSGNPPRFPGSTNPGYPSDPFHDKNNTSSRAPLTPCMPNQLPKVQMRSPSAFHDFQNQHLPGSVLKIPTNNVQAKNFEMYTSEAAIQNEQKDDESHENDAEINVEDYGPHTVEDDRLRNNLRIIWIPSFGDELYDTPLGDMSPVNGVWAVSSSDNISDVLPGIIGNLRRRDTVILEDAENNRNNVDAGFADDENDDDDDDSFFNFLSRDLNFLRKRMLCREISTNSTDDFLSERIQTIQEEDAANHQRFRTPDDFRNLLRQPSHFRCALCDTDLELPQDGHVTFAPESADLPSSVLLNNHREIDLYCPECDLIRYVNYSHGV